MKNTISESQWTSFLAPQNEDPYVLYKDNIAYSLENLIVKIQNELVAQNFGWTNENARKMAVCLVMEQMLAIQNEYAPNSLKAMTIALFSELPSVADFKNELIEKAQESVLKKKSWWKKFIGK